MGIIYANGINQGDLYSLLDDMITKQNLRLAHLDTAGGVTTYVADTDYASLWAMDTMATRHCSAAGLSQSDIVDILDDYITSYNGMVAKLNLDATVTDTDYAALTDYVNNGYTGNIKGNGAYQGNIVYQLQLIITANNTIDAKLDADLGAVTTWSVACDITDNVDVQNVTSA